MDCSLPGSSVPVILQASVPKWVAISFPRGSSQLRDQIHFLHLLHWQADSLPLSHLGSPYLSYSCVWVCVSRSVMSFSTPWTVAHQAPPPMGFSWQEHWRGLPLPSPGYLPDPGIEPGSPTFQSASLLSELSGKPQEYWTG